MYPSKVGYLLLHNDIISKFFIGTWASDLSSTLMMSETLQSLFLGNSFIQEHNMEYVWARKSVWSCPGLRCGLQDLPSLIIHFFTLFYPYYPWLLWQVWKMIITSLENFILSFSMVNQCGVYIVIFFIQSISDHKWL